MKRLFWIGFGFAVSYWIIESFLDTFVFHKGAFLDRLLLPDYNELWMRLVVTILLISFGVYAQSRTQKIRKAEDRLERMNACFLSFGPDPVANINRLTALCGELLGASRAFYNRLDRGALHAWGQWNPSAARLIECGSQNICHQVIERGGEDVLVVPNLPDTPYAALDPGIALDGLRTYVGKAVRLGDQVVGSLCTLYTRDFSPSEDDKRLMGIIASAIGVEEVRYLAESALRDSEHYLRKLSSALLTAEEAERKQLARLLHDSVGQSLSAIKYSIEGTLNAIEGAVDEDRIKRLRASVPLIREVVNEIRRIQRDLWPATLDELGIIAALNAFCKQFRDIYQDLRTDVRVEVREEDVPKALKVVIYRILQEAMNNVAKHSRAEVVHVELQKTDGLLRFAVRDDGQGFDRKAAPADDPGKGLGLSSMKERAELSGGKFTLDSRVGAGTRIEVSWPLGGSGPSPGSAPS